MKGICEVLSTTYLCLNVVSVSLLDCVLLPPVFNHSTISLNLEHQLDCPQIWIALH
jgi:hypothetical protein